MRRRQFILFVSSSFLVCPSIALAQQGAKQTKIGWLAAYSRDERITAKMLQTFRQHLEHLGHIEGRDIAIEFRYADLNNDRLPALAAELVEQKVGIIVTISTPATVAARKATSTIPIVAISITDPVGQGLVESLARPGGNVTGLTFGVGLDIFSKGLELLKEAVPGLQTVALLMNPANPVHKAVASQMEAVALTLNLRAKVFQARHPEEIAAAFEAIAQSHYGAACIVADTLFARERSRVVKLAMTYRLPSMHQLREEAEAGGLMSYGPDPTEMYRRAAAYVDAIIKGAKPADLPVQQPTKFELVINLKAAKALGLNVPPSLLVLADDLIE
ncbi:ABC transporter substrate-binding protein [Bradyrhizobium sp. Ec3.3]|uniref:ABC transporter substrate-binding protein n=1 Tax=Bradyrhizobium sp. Ec3.3 TaxID=189753 RepID=UPI0004042B85|nr:ABC transporter substrate-binding protein [Bradyrhizobium sp. Ec3.3]